MQIKTKTSHFFALPVSKNTEKEDASDLRRVQSQAMGLDPGPVFQKCEWTIQS